MWRASRGPTTRNVVWSPAVPWTSTSGGPSPDVNTAIGVPSAEVTRYDGVGSAMADSVAVHGRLTARP